MFTILERNEESFTISRSEFIGIVLHADSVELAKRYLEEIKKEYPKAKHYCYAYIIGDKQKGFDDGEPNKAASKPLLDLLKKKQLAEVLLVVVRYFGGVLLGASRLLGAYLEAGTRVLASSDFTSISEKYVYKANLSYKDFDSLKRISKIEDISFENILYGDRISVDLLLDEEKAKYLVEQFPHMEMELYGKKKVYGK